MTYFVLNQAGIGSLVLRQNTDGSITSIPTVEDNIDYVAYQAWCSAGNTPALWTASGNG